MFEDRQKHRCLRTGKKCRDGLRESRAEELVSQAGSECESLVKDLTFYYKSNVKPTEGFKQKGEDVLYVWRALIPVTWKRGISRRYKEASEEATVIIQGRDNRCSQ